jgi:hypothetical protein
MQARFAGGLCPKLCPRGAIIDPKPPPASQHEKEKPLGKLLVYRGASLWEVGLKGFSPALPEGDGPTITTAAQCITIRLM